MPTIAKEPVCVDNLTTGSTLGGSGVNSATIHRVLRQKGVEYLYHANTVTTACSFLLLGGLASRDCVESRQLLQTPQLTDSKDKALGIWDRIFLDGVDVHARGGRRNSYGPVLLVFPVSILYALPEGSKVGVTRKNPYNWTPGESYEDRYFTSESDLHREYAYGDFGKHIILHVPGGILPFSDAHAHIMLDDPGLSCSDGANAYDRATARLKAAARKGKVKLTIEKRICNPVCRCRTGLRKSYDNEDLDFWF